MAGKRGAEEKMAAITKVPLVFREVLQCLFKHFQCEKDILNIAG